MTIEAIIEIPKGSRNKYEKDEESGRIVLDRAIYGPVAFPFEYGYIEGTKAQDGDPVDVVLLSTFPTFPGCVVKAEVIGYLEMEDESGIDNKILAVPTAKVDPRWAHIQDVKDLPQGILQEVKEFFEVYKRLEPNKWVKVRDFKSKGEAEKLIESSKL